MTWKKLEDKVRDIASYRWNCTAVSENIAGIQCDCVLKVDAEQWVVVEITEERNLDKVRRDIIKLKSVKNALMNKEIICRSYIVMKDVPTNSMRETGKAQNVKVMSLEEFEREYFDYKSYVHMREKKQFGSLVNAETGEPEENTYINVEYLNIKNGKEYGIDDIISALKKGKKVVLKGDFGLGKSRCVKQIFDVINSRETEYIYTIAINLREHWGARRGIEILARHFEELGLEAKNFIKNYEQSNIIYLLDGFDEIGTQSWSSDIRKMQHIREISVCALKDLINKVHGGVLIVGRDYYFNSDSELMNCLGLKERDTIILECHSEFTEKELINYIKSNLPEYLNEAKLEELPTWFPKRPLVIQLLLKYAGEVFSDHTAFDDICSFWYVFLEKMCDREAKIYPALNPEVIKQVLILLATQTRNSNKNTGPITQTDLSNVFESVTGIRPTDESAIMLQRLPSLGRISADSPDRQFLDLFILNGLRAEGIIQSVKDWDLSYVSHVWKNSLDSVGYAILAEYINKDERNFNAFLSMARNATNSKNQILASDIIASISYMDIKELDYKGLHVSEGYITHLSFEEKEVSNLNISDSIIEKLDLTNAKLGKNVVITGCDIGTIYGISSYEGVPQQIRECKVDKFETFATTTLIKKANLTVSQKIFITMIRRIFYQPGAGRKEETLLRGLGAAANKHCAEKILNKLLDEKIITRHKGDEGYIYKAVRGKTAQIDKILTELTLSTDPLWEKISNIT